MHKQTNSRYVTNKWRFPSGPSQYDGLVDKGELVWTEKERERQKGSLHTVDNNINWNANPLHMNAHSFGNNCNQHIFTPMCRDLFCWKLVLLLESSSKSLSLSVSLFPEDKSIFVVRIDTSESHSEIFSMLRRLPVFASQVYIISSCRLVDLFCRDQ
jgi:hypothetical protein